MNNEKLPPIIGSYQRKHKLKTLADGVPTKKLSRKPAHDSLTQLKQPPKLKERRSSKDSGVGFGCFEYPPMVASNTDVYRIDTIKTLEVDAFKTLFVFQGVDLNSEVRINSINVLCNGFRIIGNVSYVIKKQLAGEYAATVSTFTIESAVNSNGYGVFLTIAPSVLLKIISILSDEDISTLVIDGKTISSDCVAASA